MAYRSAQHMRRLNAEKEEEKRLEGIADFVDGLKVTLILVTQIAFFLFWLGCMSEKMICFLIIIYTAFASLYLGAKHQPATQGYSH